MKVGDVYKYTNDIGQVHRLEIVSIGGELNFIYGEEVVEVLLDSGMEIVTTTHFLETDCVFDEESPHTKER